VAYGDTAYSQYLNSKIQGAGTGTYTTTSPTSGNWSGVDTSASNPLWQAAAPTAAPAPTTTATQPVDPYKAYQDALAAERAAELERNRTSAYDTMNAILAGFGIDTTGGGLASTIKNWIWDDKPTEWIKVELRKTAEYNKRFPGMADLIKRGQFMDEATYIAQERSYRAVLNGWGLPTGFYDDPSDFGRFIANGVSAKEVDDRVRSAKTFLDSSNPAYKQALTALYGVGEGSMLAYVLDGDRAQSIIQKQMKEAALSGSASSKGDFDLSADQTARYAETLGQNYDAIGADQIGALEKSMSELGRYADQNERFAAIDNEAFNRTDVLDAGLLNDTKKQLASERRGQREKARFSGTTAITKGSLSRNSGA
jgi:hypothetical protein